MKKYLLVLVSLCCALLPALAEHPEYPELKKSDANIIGHVLDKKTSEHLPYITIALKGIYRNRHRRYRTLLPEESAGRKLYDGSQLGRV